MVLMNLGILRKIWKLSNCQPNIKSSISNKEMCASYQISNTKYQIKVKIRSSISNKEMLYGKRLETEKFKSFQVSENWAEQIVVIVLGAALTWIGLS